MILCGVGGDWAGFEGGVTTQTSTETGYFSVGQWDLNHLKQYFLVRLGKSTDTVPAAYDYNWEWNQLPGYPSGRVWDGVTIASDFPQWNWSNWPNNWFMASSEDDDPALVALFTVDSRARFEEAQRLIQLQKIQKAQRLLRVSRVVAELAIPVSVLLDIWLESEMARHRNEGPWSYVVYQKLQSITNRVYTGRSMGPGDALTVMRARDSSHLVKNHIEGYQAAQLNAFITTLGVSSHGYAAMVGREQQVMDYHGGSVSDRGGYEVPGQAGRTRATNKIRGVAKNSVLSVTSWLTSIFAYGWLWDYTGDPMGGAPILPDRPIMLQGSVPPYFFPN